MEIMNKHILSLEKYTRDYQKVRGPMLQNEVIFLFLRDTFVIHV